MTDSIQRQIDCLARMAVGAEPGNLPGLVDISEQAAALAEALTDANLAALSLLAQRVQQGFESIIFRESDSPEQSLRDVHRTIDELQRACSTATPAADVRAVASPSVEDETPIDASLLAAWIAGCDGMLADLEGQLLLVERNPGDVEAPGEIRRILHTLKGECGVLALHDVQRVCHEAESLMDRRSEAGTAPPIDILLSLVDWLHEHIRALSADPKATSAGFEQLLASIVSGQGTGSASRGDDAAPAPVTMNVPAASDVATAAAGTDPLAYVVAPGAEDNVSDFLCEAREHISGAEEALLALEHDASNNELLNTVFRAFHTIKGVAGFIHLTPIVSLAHRAEQLLDGARSGAIALGRDELDVILSACDMLLKLLAMVEGGARPAPADFEKLLVTLDGAAVTGRPSPTPAPGPGPGSGVTNAAPAVGASSPSALTPPALSPILSGPPRVAEAPASSEAPGVKTNVKHADQTVKVSTSRMDTLVTMVGELVIAQQMVVQDAASLGPEEQRALRTLGHVQKIVRDLQEIAMALRMVSLKSTFQRMTRLVRDVSVKGGKQIVCVAEGEDVELDRNVVEEITDPLVHMIRNACDHGLEPSVERIAAGKPAAGHVFLKAYHSGGSIVIEIGDDGRGLRREKILAKAKSKGLIPPDADEAGIPDSEVFNLIFLPGFSTAETVTDISGRGVGMDVVRRNIESLRGKIEIRSVPGGGTTFLMRLPLTMAIIDGMIVRVGTQRYVLPTLSVEHAFRPDSTKVSTVLGQGEMVDVRGRLLPIYRLGRVLGLEEGTAELSGSLFIVVEAGASKCALMVDEILGQQQVVIKNLGTAGEGLKGVAGGAILGDGCVALILDVGSIVAHAARAAA